MILRFWFSSNFTTLADEQALDFAILNDSAPNLFCLVDFLNMLELFLITHPSTYTFEFTSHSDSFGHNPILVSYPLKKNELCY